VARLVSAHRRAAAVSAACTLSLALGTMGGLPAHSVGAAVAVALSALPTDSREGPEGTPQTT
jgi:hypothetical protein